MTPDYEIIGKRMKQERVKNKLTQEEIAEKLDTSVAFYNRLETGRTHINLKRMVQIAEILKVPAGYFLNGTNENTEDYLDEEFKKILDKCTPKQQKFIYKVAELVISESKS